MGNSRSEFENSLHQTAKSLTPFQLSFSILIKKLSRIQSTIQQHYHLQQRSPNASEELENNTHAAKCYKHEKIVMLKILDRAEEMMVQCKQMEGAQDIDWTPYERALHAMRKRVLSLEEREDLTSMEVLQDPPELVELGLDG